MAKYVTEFIGTFFLVLTIGLSVVIATEFAPLAIGSTLMAMVYMGWHISGAHYNPAVSMAVLLLGKMERADFVPYLIAQAVGAAVAGLVVFGLLGATFAPAPAPEVSTWSALGVEVLFTVALCLVIFNVAMTKATEGNSFYGLAIGFTIAAGAFAGGPLSGGAYNPAVGFGPILVESLLGNGSFRHLWLYFAGPILGGLMAVAVFRLQRVE